MPAALNRLARGLTRLVRTATGASRRPAPMTSTVAVPAGAGRGAAADSPPTRARPSYPGDFAGVPAFEYAPQPDGDPDAGEVVWAWVPFEEDHTRGKDRPVLLVGRDGPWLLGLQLTSKDHVGARSGEGERARWADLGPGPWDSRGRASEVRLDRVLRLDPGVVRREGSVLDRERYDQVAAAFRTARSGS